eukprot:3141854-Pleurochrysis_carterae.AAC.2
MGLAMGGTYRAPTRLLHCCGRRMSASSMIFDKCMDCAARIGLAQLKICSLRAPEHGAVAAFRQF